MNLLGNVLHVDCTIYADICQCPAVMGGNGINQVVFNMKAMRFIQPDELTHIRCLIEFASFLGHNVEVIPPFDGRVKFYSEGMGLFRNFTDPGTQFPNSRTSSYIPLTRIDSDRNDFLYHEFQKIFDQMHLSPTVIPNLCLSFTEIADNIFYHSGATDNSGWGYISAQVLRDKVKMSFTDIGVGFENAYRRCGTDRGRPNIQLLEDSLKYMESRYNIPGQRATRGIGLHEAVNLVKTTRGRLTLRSFDGMVSLYGNTPTRAQITSWIFCGTQVSMEIPI